MDVCPLRLVVDLMMAYVDIVGYATVQCIANKRMRGDTYRLTIITIIQHPRTALVLVLIFPGLIVSCATRIPRGKSSPKAARASWSSLIAAAVNRRSGVVCCRRRLIRDIHRFGR